MESIYSCLQICKSYQNPSRFSRVMIINVLPPFFMVHSVYSAVIWTLLMLCLCQHLFLHDVYLLDRLQWNLPKISCWVGEVNSNQVRNQTILASCLIYARPLRPDRWLVGARFVNSWRPFRVLVWVRSFIEPDFLKMYHSTIYHSRWHLINLLWKLG